MTLASHRRLAYVPTGRSAISAERPRSAAAARLVGWQPWLIDLAVWRNYDPTTIPGVGNLVRSEAGPGGTRRLIGKNLMTKKEEVLVDRGDASSMARSLPSHAIQVPTYAELQRYASRLL